LDTRRIDDLRSLRPERVCLIKPSALGDVVNALPVLSALRAIWPEAWMAWVVNRSLRGLLDGHPELDEVIPLDRSGARLSPGGASAVVRFLAGLRERRFEVTIDLQGLLRSGIIAAATRAPIRVGLADAREGATQFYTHRVTPPGSIDDAHAVDRMLSLASAFGADTSNPRFVVAFDEEDRLWARSVLAGVANPRLVLNLGARWLTKRWPPEHFAEIARRAIESRGAGLVAVGAPEDRPLVDALRARLPSTPILDLCGRTTLPQLAALAAESELFVSNDTGPLHLAAAAGARVVGVYTCTSPRLNGPCGPRATAIQTGVWCAGSYLKRCRRLECFAELTPDRVWPEVLAQLDATPAAGTTAA
jgi:lipopolysaccharide heptosyltransferase I